MRPFFSGLFLFFFTHVLSAQTGVIADQVYRKVEFAELNRESNKAFFRRNGELPKYILQGIRSGLLTPFHVDYSGNEGVYPLTIEEFEERNVIPFDSSKVDYFIDEVSGDSVPFYWPREVLFDSDYHIIGIDYLGGISNGDTLTEKEYLFINFYLSPLISGKPELKYLFSVAWNDVIKMLKETKNLPLYYTNSYRSWWRGDVFILNDAYPIDMNIGVDYLMLGRNHLVPAYQYKNRTAINDLTHYKEIQYNSRYSNYPFELFFLETRQGQNYNIEYLGLEYLPDWDYHPTNDRLLFNWNDFLKVAADSGWTKNSEVYAYTDALLAGKLQFSNTIPSINVSTNGKYKNGQTDALSHAILIPSLQKHVAASPLQKFKTSSDEEVYMKDSLNAHLYNKGKGLPALIYNYVLKERLQAYETDSMNRLMSHQDYISRITVMAETARMDGDIKKGEIIYYEGKYYRAQKDNTLNEYDIYSSYISPPAELDAESWEPVKMPIYEPKILDDVELIYTLTFDANGKNKQYHLTALQIAIPYDQNIKGIRIPICYVKWEDLKPLLLKDKKAFVKYQGKKVNLATILEDRAFFSYQLKTGFLEPGE